MEDAREDCSESRFQALNCVEKHFYALVFTRERARCLCSVGAAQTAENRPTMPRKPKPELLDQDAPEATQAWFAKARPASEVLPGLRGKAAAKAMLKPKRGRPALETPNEHVNIRPIADIG